MLDRTRTQLRSRPRQLPRPPPPSPRRGTDAAGGATRRPSRDGAEHRRRRPRRHVVLRRHRRDDRRVRRRRSRHGKVVKIDSDEVLLDIGYKSEGVIPSKELSIRNDVDPNEVVSLGEEIEALVLQKEDKDGRLILSKKRAQYERAWGTIEQKKENDERRLRSGHRGRQGRPHHRHRAARLPARVARRPAPGARPAPVRRPCARVQDHRARQEPQQRRAVAARAYLEETQREQRDEFLTNLKPGEIRKGVVSSVVNFGAFVDLGGMDGLVHVSELSWKHVDHPSSVVQVGDEVTVQVLDVDLSRERISLSLKATQQDPWQEFATGSPGRRARLRPGHQARAVRRVRAGRRRHRGSGAHLRDGRAPRRGARAGRHARRGAVGEDHRHRPRAPADLAVDQAGRRRWRGRGRVPASSTASTRTTSRATTSGPTTPRARGAGRCRRRRRGRRCSAADGDRRGPDARRGRTRPPRAAAKASPAGRAARRARCAAARPSPCRRSDAAPTDGVLAADEGSPSAEQLSSERTARFRRIRSDADGRVDRRDRRGKVDGGRRCSQSGARS